MRGRGSPRLERVAWWRWRHAFRRAPDFMAANQGREAGGRSRLECWISSEEMDASNAAGVGLVGEAAEFPWKS
jgi:hypothetical protein